ncbi:MAG: universal stress protein [Thermomicrobiales bacterium]
MNSGESGTTPAVRLLVPLDDSRQALAALPYARALATPGTEIVLLSIVPVADEVIAGTGQMLVPADQMAVIEESHTREAIEPIAKGLRDAGHQVSVQVAVGDPAQRIVDIASSSGATMIVMASRGRGTLGRLIYGSVADRVARDAPVPTMVVRAEQQEQGPVGISRLVVPLDGSSLAEGALTFAETIARRLGAPIFLVRAVNPADLMPPAVGMAEAIPYEIYDETEKQMEDAADSYLEETAKRLRGEGFSVATRVLSGPPAAAIEETTKFGDVTVLVSHERSGVMRWLIGSVAEQLVREDESPVILVPAPEHAVS